MFVKDIKVYHSSLAKTFFTTTKVLSCLHFDFLPANSHFFDKCMYFYLTHFFPRGDALVIVIIFRVFLLGIEPKFLTFWSFVLVIFIYTTRKLMEGILRISESCCVTCLIVKKWNDPLIPTHPTRQSSLLKYSGYETRRISSQFLKPQFWFPYYT